MSTGPEHYTEAEKLLRSDPDPDFGETPAELIARAQVHATLALAAATALSHTQGGTLEADFKAWYRTASEGPGETTRRKAAEAARAAEYAAEMHLARGGTL